METQKIVSDAINQQNNKLFYKNDYVYYSKDLNLRSIFTKENIQHYLTASDLEGLSKYLPDDLSVQVSFINNFYFRRTQ